MLNYQTSHVQKAARKYGCQNYFKICILLWQRMILKLQISFLPKLPSLSKKKHQKTSYLANESEYEACLNMYQPFEG